MAVTLEILQGQCLITDDIVDDSITRRGRECWHKTVGVSSAIIDIGLLREIQQWMLSKFIGDHKYYNEISDILSKIIRIGYVGQSLDLMTCADGQAGDLSKFNMDLYRDIMIRKGSFTVLVYPLRLALYMANIDDTNVHSAIEQVAVDIGILFGMQDDYLDVYGDPNLTGEVAMYHVNLLIIF